MSTIRQGIRAGTIHLLLLVLLHLLETLEHVLESLELRKLRVVRRDILRLQLLIFLQGVSINSRIIAQDDQTKTEDLIASSKHTRTFAWKSCCVIFAGRGMLGRAILGADCREAISTRVEFQFIGRPDA